MLYSNFAKKERKLLRKCHVEWYSHAKLPKYKVYIYAYSIYIYNIRTLYDAGTDLTPSIAVIIILATWM